MKASSELPDPNCSTLNDGCARCAALLWATEASITFIAAVSSRAPFTTKLTIVECPSSDTADGALLS
jgi:hypothetical protein